MKRSNLPQRVSIFTPIGLAPEGFTLILAQMAPKSFTRFGTEANVMKHLQKLHFGENKQRD
jgi:hypothetical protein